MAPSIAIIGGGPVGLTLAKLLDSSPLTKDCYTIFESDASASARTSAGGSLDLHTDTGLAALKKAGLYNEFLKYGRFGGAEDFILGDKHGKVWFSKVDDNSQVEVDNSNPGKDARPEIARQDLQHLLLASVSESAIRWGHRASSVSPEGIITFTSGETAGPFDLIVGADGAWSKVRNVLDSPKPRYSGISGYRLRVLDAENKHPEVAKSIGHGNNFCFSDGKSMQGQNQGDGSYLIGLWGVRPESWTRDLEERCNHDPIKICQAILEEYHDWTPELRKWIEASEPTPTYQPSWTLYEIPYEGDGPRWSHKKGFTLAGDAAHVMTPFAGKGVNTGMTDALELADAIITAVEKLEDIDQAVLAYEEKMIPRAFSVMKETARNKGAMFHPDAPGIFIEAMMEEMQGGPPSE